MRYRWNDYSLDREGTLLTRQGQQVDVSRKVLDCITHLVEHRDRVVGYDELVRKVWGHENVTNHQLSQVILAARRALGDDGQAQRLIRTMPGLGYRWVGALCESTDTMPLPQVAEAHSPAEASADKSSSEIPLRTQPDAVGPASAQPAMAVVWYRNGKLHAVAALALCLAVVAAVGWQLRKTGPTATTQPASAATTGDPLVRLDEALWRGQYEDVREGLARMPASLADTPDAGILEFRLDMARGRFDRAAEKLALQQRRAKAAADPVWQAKLLTAQSILNAKTGKSAQEILAPAESAIALLESAGDAVSPRTMGEALSTRGNALMKASRFEPAMEDLVRARDLLLEAGDQRGATITSGMLARVWMRTGRMADALDEMTEIASAAEKSGDPGREIASRNTAIKIQVELLHWRDALTSSERSVQLLRSVPDSIRRGRTLQLRALVLTGNGHLREAAALLEEVDALDKDDRSLTIPAMFHLASGHAELALADAAEAFAEDDENDKSNLILENKEGALLLWMIAAQDLAANGDAMPKPSSAQRNALEHPESSIGRIARGRWLWSQKKNEDAQAEFQRALEETQQSNRPFRMLLASEPLIELLLQRGDKKTARQVLTKLRAHDPERFDQDYRANLLSLKMALASSDKAAVETAYRSVQALAGERMLPADVLKACSEAGVQIDH